MIIIYSQSIFIEDTNGPRGVERATGTALGHIAGSLLWRYPGLFDMHYQLPGKTGRDHVVTALGCQGQHMAVRQPEQVSIKGGAFVKNIHNFLIRLSTSGFIDIHSAFFG